MHLNVHCSTLYNSQDMEAIWMSTDTEMDKEDVVYTREYYLTIKNNNAICNNMHEPRDYHTK